MRCDLDRTELVISHDIKDLTQNFIESLYIMVVNSTVDRIIGETGVVNQFDHNSQTIFFDHNYDNPVIFTQPLTYNGSQPAIVRIEDIQGDRFTASLQEPENLDGKHTKESFSYIVLEQGTWELEDNTVLEVGKVNTDILAPNGWENIELTNDFTRKPMVFGQVQTDNDNDFVRTRLRNTSSDSFQIAMEEEEAFNTSHGKETVGWLAISAGSGNWSQNKYRVGTTGNSVTDRWHTIDFGNSFSRSPVFLSSIASYDGSDPSGLRYNKLSNNQVEVKIEEDTTLDTETNHTTEVVNFFAIDGNNFLTGSQVGEVKKPFDIKSCQLDLIRIGDHESSVWSNDKFDGHVCREITGDVTNFSLTLDIEQGGFDTGIAAVNPRIRVDEVESFDKMSSNVNVDIDGSGAWWVGPKIDIRKNKSGGTDGWYENYVIENASRSPQEYHERLVYDGNYLGQTNQDSGTYKHYLVPHNSWNQFWAIRQNYRSSGSVDMDTIIDIWRDNGLPNGYISMLRTNIETKGEVNGMVEMSGLDIPSW